MGKRYQVFISSTKEDLEDARQEVSQALLRANCFPAAMELFPAADEGIDDYIKQKIDESDYMVLIVAGRYGSVNPASGLSYTEEEYDYALQQGKPIVRLVHASPFEDLPGSRIEQDAEKKAKLEAFREKVTSSSIARLYESDRELGAEVVLGIIDAQQRHPSVGWVRADTALDAEEALEIARLRKQLAEYQSEDSKARPAEIIGQEMDQYPLTFAVFSKIYPEDPSGAIRIFKDAFISRASSSQQLKATDWARVVNADLPQWTEMQVRAICLALEKEGLVLKTVATVGYVRLSPKIDELIGLFAIKSLLASE
ncbi:MAG: DUF4062 domain-containing protein [Pseudomonadota bacterium]